MGDEAGPPLPEPPASPQSPSVGPPETVAMGPGKAGGPPAPPSPVSLQAVGRRLTKESSMIFSGTVLLKGVTIISSIALARILGADALGLWAIVTASAGLLWVVAEFGVGAAAVTVIGEVKADPGERAKAESTVYLLSLGVGGAVIVAYVLATPLLAYGLYR